MLRVLIIADETQTRQRLRQLLDLDSGVEILAEYENSPKTMEAIQVLRPELVFIDLHEPAMDEITTIRNLPAGCRPLMIVVSAREDLAFRAFQLEAVDFLLKPLDAERTQESLRRARQRLNGENLSRLAEQVQELRRSLQPDTSPLGRLVVKNTGRLIILNPADVDWIEAADNYACLHTGSKTHIIRETLSQLERSLETKRFIRIHRSTLVNLDRVQELRSQFNGDYQVILQGGVTLGLGRKYRQNVLARLGIQPSAEPSPGDTAETTCQTIES